MKRDMICISKIIEKLESSKFNGNTIVDKFTVKGCSDNKISYHIQLLKDAEFIKTAINDEGTEVPVRLTWKGHEYVFQALDSTVNIVKEGINLVDDIS